MKPLLQFVCVAMLAGSLAMPRESPAVAKESLADNIQRPLPALMERTPGNRSGQIAVYSATANQVMMTAGENCNVVCYAVWVLRHANAL